MGRFFKEHQEHFLVSAGAILLALVGFWVAYQYVEPAPPSTIRMATGSAGGAYATLGPTYAEDLQRERVTLELIPSAGSVENLKLLVDGQVDIAFVQGGTGDTNDFPGLMSLGSLYYEPLWVFHSSSKQLQQLNQLKGMRIAVGAEGSGTRAVALQILADNGVTTDNAKMLPVSGQDAVEALKRQQVDAVFVVAGIRAQAVQSLLHSEEITLFSFSRARAYLRNHRFLDRVSLPEGTADLARNLPLRDTTLVAPTANLVVREDFHPALISLILQAATRIHAKGGLLEQPGQFPNQGSVTFPLSEDAERFYRKGPSFLQRYLPFWAATLIDRLIVMIVPLVTLLLPMSKIVPPTYRWRVRRKIYRWYDQLRELDLQSERVNSSEEAEHLLTHLLDVEHDVMQVAVPKSYMDAQYNLRLHIRLIRERLERSLGPNEA